MFGKKKEEKVSWQFIISPSEHLKNLIKKAEEDLVNTRVQQWIFQREYMHPVHIGKNEAHEKVLVYEKRAAFIEENLQVYKLYAEQKGINL